MRPRTHFGIVATLGLLALITAPPALAREGRGVASWPQRGYDPTHLGLNPFETILGTSNASQLVLKWHASIGSIDSSPIEADGKLFVTTFADDTLFAFDESTGTQLWTFNNGSQHDSINTPAVANGRVFVEIDDFLFAVDEATGVVQWRRTIGVSGAATTAVTNGPTTILYVGGGSQVWAIDGSNGHVLWSQNPDPPYEIQASPTVGNGLVYVTDDNLVLHAYDMQSGLEAWSVALPVGRDSVPTDVALDGDTLYVASIGERLFAVNALDGTLLWYADAPIDSNPAVAYGMVYVETLGTYPSPVRLFAFRKSDGAIRWRAKLGSGTTGGFHAGPSVANGVVYAPSIKGGVAAFDASDGMPLWRDMSIDTVNGSPAVVNGMVFVTSFAGVYAYGLP